MRTLDLFLADLVSGAYALDYAADDLDRITELVGDYADLPLGFADASVVGYEKGSGGRVLTLDVCHFGAAARAGRIRIVPD